MVDVNLIGALAVFAVIAVFFLVVQVRRLKERIEKLEAVIPRTVWTALAKAREARRG